VITQVGVEAGSISMFNLSNQSQFNQNLQTSVHRAQANAWQTLPNDVINLSGVRMAPLLLHLFKDDLTLM
jgi:hypothetical protein